MMTKKKRNAITLSIIMIISLLLTCVIIACLAPEPMFHGDYPYYPDVSSITDAADVIIVGETVTARDVEELVVDVTPNQESKESIPYTISTVKVTQTIKGNVRVGDTITIKQLGNYKSKPESTLHEIDGYLNKDTDGLMFLSEYTDCPYSAVNPAQGIVQVKNGSELYSASRYSLFGYNGDGSRSINSLESAIAEIQANLN